MHVEERYKIDVERELSRGNALSVIALLNHLLQEAYELGASDLHLDPAIGRSRVRMRVDGVLRDVHTLPASVHSEVIARIKVLAGLRTDEHTASQDGRFRHVLRDIGAHLDLRVSIMPTYHGENAVLRLLPERAHAYLLSSLGFDAAAEAKIISALQKRSGMLLATGPTGSGKTTTLYTLLQMLNVPEVSIVTIEDPVEYAIADIEQIQVNPRAGLTFGSGLRSIVRQDPDIIMVGEIRDAETAGIAVNTALTGHLLLSTLHTTNAATTLPRLLDMGIDAYLVASTINVAIGQRLVRSICADCKEAFKITAAMARAFSHIELQQPLRQGEEFFRGAGCEQCGHSGYRGRLCMNEVLVADTAVRDAILRKMPANELQKLAIAAGMTTLLEDGVTKVRAGHTTLEEVLRAHAYL